MHSLKKVNRYTHTNNDDRSAFVSVEQYVAQFLNEMFVYYVCAVATTYRYLKFNYKRSRTV